MRNKNIINFNSLKKKLLDEKNKRAILSEKKVVAILSENNSFKIDCSGVLLPNGKRTDLLILLNNSRVLTEIYSPWKEKHTFLEKIKQKGAAKVTSIEMLKKITSEKYCDKKGKCQFSSDTPHLFIIDLDNSMTDVFPVINNVSEFSRAFSCEASPSGYAGVFHEKDSSGNYLFENISGAIGIRDNKIVEFSENPNARNKLPTEFIKWLKK